MDVLASCNVTDLPEQQTRTQHLPERVLEDESLELGFSACCRCARPLTYNIIIECPGCRRVKYCSHECRHQDASIVLPAERDDVQPQDDDDDEGDNNALGHSSIICALLQTCNQDEKAETTMAQNQDHNNNNNNNNNKNQVALARVESEYESYPATLAQMLQEGSCFQPVLRRQAQSNLVIHIVGAARDAELEWNFHKETNWVDCYVQALSDLAESYRFRKIQLYFCGPDVASATSENNNNNNNNAAAAIISKGIQAVMMMSKVKTGTDQLEIFLCPGYYTYDNVVSRIPPVDIAVMFNPGLTCPDYPSWHNTLNCIPSGTPILLCTNTQMEVLADIQFLLEHGHVLINALPPPWMGNPSPMDEDAKLGGSSSSSSSTTTTTATAAATAASSTSEETYFWGENPYCGWRVRQSGTMANDVYVKNRWMFGGFIDRQKGQPQPPPPPPVKRRATSRSPPPPPPPPPPTKMVVAASYASSEKKTTQTASSSSSSSSSASSSSTTTEKKEGSRKKRKPEGNGVGNCKRSNPALI